MALNAPIALSGEDRSRAPFTLLPAKATNLNRNGGAVQVHRELSAGATLVVKNQRGTVVKARVVAQLAAIRGVPTYAIEFLDQDEKAKCFWGISFPTTNAE